MRAFLFNRYALFALGMAAFGWLIFATPAATVISRVQPQTTPAPGNRIFLPLVSQNFVNLPWLNRVNSYRAQAGLSPLSENAAWSNGASLHARYMVKTDQVTDYQLVVNPEYTPEGAEAARHSLLFGIGAVTTTDESAIDIWLRSPFQALSILDPELRQTGFGSYREADGGTIQMAAAFDVQRGWNDAPAPAYPVFWPGNGQTVRLRSYSGGDYPDPLKSPGCAGSQGLPLILQVGKGSLNVGLAASNPTLFRSGSTPLQHCAFTETSYDAGNPTDTTYGRLLLSVRDAIVLLPKDPLTPGATYTVSVNATLNGAGQTFTWSFTVAADAAP
jgi:uncharacterized protein YkwD